MSKWSECKLGEQINLKRGYDLPARLRQDGEIPIFSSSGITGFHNEKMCNAPGVITGRYGTIGQVFFSKTPYWPLNTTLYVQDFKGNDELFIYYFLQQLDWEKYSDKSAVPGVNRNDVHQEDIVIPQVTEQKAIAAVLSCLDDKIDLLHRQNKTLEAMGEALFRQWFVEETQEDWEEYSISDFADHIKSNVTPAKFSSETFLHYSLPAFDEGKRPAVELGGAILSNKYKVVSNSILVSKLNPRVPRIWPIGELQDKNAVCSTEFQVLKPKSCKLYGYLYFLLRSSDAVDSLIMAASGTSGSHQRVKPEDILDIKTDLPSIELAELYSNLVMPSLNKTQSNLVQIQTLERLRNSLLPKIMNGEVRVAV